MIDYRKMNKLMNIMRLLLVYLILALVTSFAISCWLEVSQHLSYALFIPIMMIALYVLHKLYYIKFNRHIEHSVTATFLRHIASHKVRGLLQFSEQALFKVQTRELTIVSVKIHNFDEIVKYTSAAHLGELLNQYFTDLSDIIFQCGGTVDKFIGDRLIAFWGAPFTDNAHAEHACEAALLIERKVTQLNQYYHATGLMMMNIGIGVNTGVANVGDMGSRYQRNYTVLGDAVKMTQQISNNTLHYGVNIAISRGTWERQQHYIFRLLDRVKIPAYYQIIEVYELVTKKTELTSAVEHRVSVHEHAMALYFAKQWQAAQDMFHQLHHDYPEAHVYPLMLRRIEYYMDHPPVEDWDEIYSPESELWV